ncbi:hydrogenase maturation protease [Bradyrhizobium diazoefficiens]|uniref:hydrogenase maturation protease n=1 Tax=Bradyrhizobium diazoefficiens TaxID=1355477 RepID=UPI00190D8C1C|nr:hydrogenase maturation protease [Bradyrhizobium diazoefficiens]MBK3666288.1 hydrogenase maturation protease [Bradyrhizobium diazoefficiens]
MITVVACGNANRSDDGVGLTVLQLLKSRDLARDPLVRLLDAGTDGMAAMFAARGCRTLIVIDACQSGSEPGAIFEVPGSELTQRYAPSLNLHDFRWDHALYAGKAIFRDAFPDDVVVFLIEAQCLDLGLAISEPVTAAASKVADRIEELVLARLSKASSS